MCSLAAADDAALWPFWKTAEEKITIIVRHTSTYTYVHGLLSVSAHQGSIRGECVRAVCAQAERKIHTQANVQDDEWHPRGGYRAATRNAGAVVWPIVRNRAGHLRYFLFKKK